MDAGLKNPVFWLGMMIALTAAFVAAYPVNRYLLARGKGHALTHQYHHGAQAMGWRRSIPSLGTGSLTAVIAAFLLGGFLAAVAPEAESGGHSGRPASASRTTGPDARPARPAPASTHSSMAGELEGVVLKDRDGAIRDGSRAGWPEAS
jgi:hypothetical protein